MSGQVFSSTSYRQKEGELSLRAYNLTIGFVLLEGFVLNYIMCTYFTEIFNSWNPSAILVGYFALCLGGIFIAQSSSNPIISFVGYNMIVVPVGVVVSLFVQEYQQESVIGAIRIAGSVTTIMVCLATLHPKLFLSMGKTLFVCLLGVIIAELLFMFFGISTPTIWDWAIALLFCCYIGYDWAKAQEKYRSLDNAVDSAVGLYLDIINLFIRILATSGNRKSRK